ncbi:hypothetical protein TKK_0017014 [Trichogramma kaykai]
MHGRKGAAPSKGNPRPRSNLHRKQGQKGSNSQLSGPSNSIPPALGEDANSSQSPGHSTYRRRTQKIQKGKKSPKPPRHSNRRPLLSPPLSKLTKAVQCSPTDWENSKSEKPPLVDPQYSGLREETETPTESTETEEEPKPSVAATQLQGQKPTSKSSPTLMPDIILTPAAAELDISERIIERRAYETEDIIDEKDLELTTVVERSCLSDGTAVDEETREYLDSIDLYDEVRNNDRTLSERVEKLIQETQIKISQEQNNSTASVGTEANSSRKGETPILSGSNRPTDKRETIDTPMSKSTPMPNKTSRKDLPPQKQANIPEEPESTPVILNFSQPPEPDFPLFFPIPIAEGPLNKYILEHNPTMKDNRSKDNYVTFISQDCEPSTRNLRLLSDIDAIDLRTIKSRRPNIGQVIVSPFKNNVVLLLVVKRKHYDTLSTENVRVALKFLQDFMTRNNLYSTRISSNGELTDTLSPGLPTEMIQNTFRHTPTKFTICYGILYANATECQEKKLTRIKRRDPLHITDTPLEAFDKVSIDTVGKLRLTTDGNCHLLTMQCNLNKYLLAIPIPNLRASTIADALARHLICQFGAEQFYPTETFKGQVGGYAWILNEPRMGKFDKTPLLIKEILGNNNVILELSTGQQIRKHIIWTREHPLFQSYIQLERHCFLKTPTPSCSLFKSTDILKQFHTIQELQEKIKLARQTAIPPNILRNPLRVKLRRSVPLAIIGTLSKSLFGTATEDEINIIQTSQKSLSQEQSDIIKLNKEKTHLLMRSMDTVTNATQKHEELSIELDGILRSETNEIEHLQYEVRLLAHFSTIMIGIENRIRSLEQIETFLRELRSRRIPSQLLTQSIAQETAIDIQQNNLDLEIPIHREEILKISTADMIYIDGHTTAIIYIPLTERTQYKLYKLPH